MFSPEAIVQLLENMGKKEIFERIQQEATNPESPNHLKAMLELGLYKVYTTTIDADMDEDEDEEIIDGFAKICEEEIIDGFAKICEVALLGKAHTANAYNAIEFLAQAPEISPKLLLIFNHYNQILGQTSDPKIQTILGICYEYDIGTQRDLQKAKQYYALAVNQHYAPAYYLLGSHMLEDSKEQRDLFQAAANQEYAPAQNEIAIYTELTLGDKETANALYSSAAVQGYAPAQNNLALYFESIKDNLERVIPLYYLAAAQGYQEAQKNLDRYQAAVNANTNDDNSRTSFPPQNEMINAYDMHKHYAANIQAAIEQKKKAAGCCAIL